MEQPGPAPRWMKPLLAKGKTKEDFLIKIGAGGHMAAQFALRSNPLGGHLLPPKCAAGSRIIWDISGASEQLPANLDVERSRHS